MTNKYELPADISSTVRRALSEDIGTGDLTASLVPSDAKSSARVICREQAILCGTEWFEETFRQLEGPVQVKWYKNDGDSIEMEECVCELSGPARTILTGERTALNFLQLLSGTATITRQHVDLLKGETTRLLDTRKTIPGLRTAQKYAVLCGGGVNHRMGLYDAILIKENHIHAARSIAAAVSMAKETNRSIEVEVENLSELEQAIEAGVDSVLLDNFSLEDTQKAVEYNSGRVKLEASGGVEDDQLTAIASTGVDYISVGALTKHVRAIDFSMIIS